MRAYTGKSIQEAVMSGEEWRGEITYSLIHTHLSRRRLFDYIYG